MLKLRLKGYSWDIIFSLIKIYWEYSFIFKLKKEVEILGVHRAYGLKSYSLFHIALALRQKYKDLRNQYSKTSKEFKHYDKIQYALKVFSNSGYGIFGNITWSYHNFAIASTITSMGRFLQRLGELKAKQLGLKMVYSDTDSFMLNAKENDFRIQKLLNYFKNVDGLKLEETNLKAIAILGAKNYMLIFKDG